MSVTQEAILKIKNMILEGELRPGDRMPPEGLLSERLGVSRGSLREAVKALEMIHVLDVRRGDGTYVTSLDPALLTASMSFVVELQQGQTLLQLMEVRKFLETAAVRKAAQNVDEQTLELMRQEIEASRSAPIEDLVTQDVVFHRLIAQSAGNDYLASLLDAITPLTLRVRVWRAMDEHGAVERTIAEHAAILAALEKRDPELAVACMTVHICGVEDWMATNIATTEKSG